ncbi:2-hydroxychromene-2-carboxylate isomerase [Nannocystaceae bacterium ST9]
MAAKPLRFYFDITCPYAYVASTLVEVLAERTGARLEPRPILLGGVFRAHETPQKLFATLPPAKARHNFADMHRQAALAGLTLEMPANHPLRSVEALRALLIVGVESPQFWPLVHALYRAYWAEGVDISTLEGLRGVLASVPGIDVDALLARIDDPAIKQELRERTDEAIALGVFGVPTFVVEGELYWGVDRMDQVERALGGTPVEPYFDPFAPIDVWFDYSSPFAYLGCTLAERRLGDEAHFHPMLLGAVFKQVGTADVPMFEQSEAKRRLTAIDMHRQAAWIGTPFAFPTRFPMNTVLALRVTLLAHAHESAEGRRLVHRIFRAYWAEDRDIADPEVIRQLCDECGFDGAALIAGANDPAVKDALRRSTERAVQAGVFGAPTFIVHTTEGDKLYWGADRLELALRAASGDTRAY